MNKKDNNTEERELLFELYSFKASDGNTYTVRPATAAEVLSPDSNFMEMINSVGVPLLDEKGNPRLMCVTALSDTKRRGYIEELISRYVSIGGKNVTLSELSESGFTVDDILLLIKKIAGISG